MFNSSARVTNLYLSKARTWISNAICRGFFMCCALKSEVIDMSVLKWLLHVYTNTWYLLIKSLYKFVSYYHIPGDICLIYNKDVLLITMIWRSRTHRNDNPTGHKLQLFKQNTLFWILVRADFVLFYSCWALDFDKLRNCMKSLNSPVHYYQNDNNKKSLKIPKKWVIRTRNATDR